jgi:heptosyltransferase I
VKVLILKPSSLGDVIQALPVLRLLKRRFPHSTIYWWIDSGLAPLLEGDPDLAGVIRFERRRWAEPSKALEFYRGLRWMRAQRFDAVVDLQCLLRSGAVAWLAAGEILVGLDEPREGARGFYDLVSRRVSFHTHAVDWYLGVLRFLGVPLSLANGGPQLIQTRSAGRQQWSARLSEEAPPRDSTSAHQPGGCSPDRNPATGNEGLVSFDWMPARSEAAANIRSRWPVDEQPWLVVQPGARWMNKRWPVEHYATLIRDFTARHPEFRCAILGGTEDRPLGEHISRSRGSRCLDLTGRLSLPEMVEWIRASRLMVSNDTGPMHVAAAVGTPLVALFGPTEPGRTGPYGQLQHVLQAELTCAPCMKSRCVCPQPLQCLRALSPATVLDAVCQRMRDTA